MKKLLVLITAIFMTLTAVNAAESISQPPCQQQDFNKVRQQREAAFEKRLCLTEEQKAQAKEIRLNGHEKLKPVMEEIKSKKQEAQMVKLSRMAVQAQEEKLTQIDAELRVLEKKAHDIRNDNMKEFESILTRDQKKILKQMKQEGRQRYHADHPCQRPIISQPVKK